MNLIVVLLLVGGGYFLLKRAQTNALNVPAQGYGAAVTTTDNAAAFQAVQTANVALNAIPVVGPALSAVASALTASFKAASAKRAKEAIDENSAVAKAIPGWDQAVAATINAYNNGQIDVTQAHQLLQLVRANYWAETAPRIQPGRNGCQGGAMSKQQADTQFPGMKQCSGSWGAACCVGYADLENGLAYLHAALDQTDSTGQPVTVTIPTVYASKYGGINRPAYPMTVSKPNVLLQAGGGISTFLSSVGL